MLGQCSDLVGNGENFGVEGVVFGLITVSFVQLILIRLLIQERNCKLSVRSCNLNRIQFIIKIKCMERASWTRG